MENIAIVNIGWAIIFAIIAGMVAVRFRLPPVSGLLIAGMIIGPHVLGMIDENTINIFSEIGAVLLLFMIGVEFSIAKLLSAGLRPIFSSILLVFITFILMHETSLFLGLDAITALYCAAMFSLTSTAIMMKILEQKKMIDRTEVPILVTMLIIEDIIAVFMLTFFSNLKSGDSGPESILLSVLVSLTLLVISYFVILKLLKKFSYIFLRYQAEDTIILFSFGLGILMSVIAAALGLTPAIGAFLAGSIIAALPNGKEFEHAIRPFSLVFSSFFFLSVGMLIDPAAILASLDITIALIIAFMIFVFLATSFTFFLISSRGRSSAFAGIAMLPLGEFSLLIAKDSVGVTHLNLVGIASAAVLVTSIFGSVLISRYDSIYDRLKKRVPPHFINALKKTSNYFISVMSAFEPKGDFHKVFITEVRDLFYDLIQISGALVTYFLIAPYLKFNINLGEVFISAQTIALFLLVIVSSIPIAKLLLSLRKLFDLLSTIFSRTTPKATKGIILRNLFISTIFFLLFANTYLVVELLGLPKIFNWLALLFGIMFVFFLWSVIRAVSFDIMSKNKNIALLNETTILGEKLNPQIEVIHNSKYTKKKKSQ